jgi:uncharacterized protein YxjI
MPGLEQIIGDHERILVHQSKEWGEILLGFEAKNRFELRDDAGRRIGRAAEEAKGLGAWFLRNLLGHCRAASIHLYDSSGQRAGRGEKPFRFYFHRMEVYDGDAHIGAVQRRWSLFNRKFAVENAAGEEVMQIVSPLFRIWTFRLLFGDSEVGAIRKKWGGVLREMFTDADTFGVEFSGSLPLEVRKILLVATFLIDFTCFENNQGAGGSISLDLGD